MTLVGHKMYFTGNCLAFKRQMSWKMLQSNVICV